MRKVCRSALSDIPLTPSSHLIFSMEILLSTVTHLLLNIKYIGRHCRLSRKKRFRRWLLRHEALSTLSTSWSVMKRDAARDVDEPGYRMIGHCPDKYPVLELSSTADLGAT